MPKLKQSASSKGQFSAYKTRFEKNKLATLERVVRNQPNNKQAKEALSKALDKGVKYTRNRKSNGHHCKGLYNALGFVMNQPSENMVKKGPKINNAIMPLGQHWYTGCVINFNHTKPEHGLSMCQQFELLGYEKPKHVRKYKKTAR